jgi:hypothetical protein
VTRDSLSAELVRLGYPTSIVSWDGPGVGDCYAVEHGPLGWSVYYSERGERREEQVFDDERSALRYVLGWILSDNPRRT